MFEKERKEKMKHILKNLLIDAASIVIFVAITYTAAQGFSIIYTSYYQTGAVPPETFSNAATEYSVSISLVYMLLTTRKHKKEEPQRN